MKKNIEDYLRDSTFIFSGNGTFIQEIYRKYLENPNSVSEEWQRYFNEVGDDFNSLANDYDGASWKNSNLKVVGAKSEAETTKKPPTKDKSLEQAAPNYKVARFIGHFRKYGHLAANLDPLNIIKPESHPTLSLDYHSIESTELDKKIDLPHEPNFNNLSINEIAKKLRKIYASDIAYEFEYISNIEEKLWLRERIENDQNSLNNISKTDKISALKHLHRAASFEQMLHKKFPGAKRFSVEGGEATIPALEKIIDLAGQKQINNVELGMAHRGRLNVLTNICGKPYDQMIAEFKGASSIPEEYNAAGDVKYHMGYSNDRKYGDHNLHLALAYNPSHLEAVNSVVAGKTRAKQDLNEKKLNDAALPILIHGDAAFMGQGSVAESLNMAYVDAYNVGGTIHLIINNQIGFTANSNDSRSTRYCSDIAKFIESPIIHVNANNIEAVIYASIIAFEYREKFAKDIVIDLNCYRKYGHNEGDEPNFTQPIMYKAVKAMPSPDEKYAKELISQNIISETDYKKIKEERNKELEEAFQKADQFEAKVAHAFADKWKGLTTKAKTLKGDLDTGVEITKLSKLVKKLLPEIKDFNINPKIKKQFEVKQKIFDEGSHLDWALGESLAFASLLEEGYPIRLTGQDAKRGTFSHRHSVLRDMETEKEFIPLNNLSENQKAKYYVADSVLSEFAVLGFEYGYSSANPNTLTIWEAQFGDFANGAQVIFDQFISSAESKWLRLSGLVMLLPHASEGQGPEHSSARLERHLQACAEDNMQVVNCTTPANFFHVLRRQIHRDYRKPLIVMSPKSLLRHKLAVSTIEEFAPKNSFLKIIPETEKLVADDKIKKVIFCSGKIYYDLYEERAAKKINDIAIIRIEELYPFPEKEIIAQVKKYKNAEIIWCQEESENMGAWNFLDRRFQNLLKQASHKEKEAKYIGRIPSASPATGYMSVYQKEQQDILNKALS